MDTSITTRRGRTAPIVAATLVVAVIVGAAASYRLWLPELQKLTTSASGEDAYDHDADDHGHDHGHDHGKPEKASSSHAHEGHDDETSLALSREAWKNIGLTIGVIKPSDYVKTIAVPSMVVERPGHSQVEIVAPMNGIVTRVYLVTGQVIEPGDPLYDLRLTHEDLVSAQREFLESAQELDVVEAEIQRLESVGEGVVAGKRVLEQKYLQQKLKAKQHAQRQGLLLHGLSDEQVTSILDTRRLVQSVTVSAPPFEMEDDHHDIAHLYHVQSIAVRRGQHVVAGNELGVLADHCQLYVEGKAFEDDAHRLIQVAGQHGSIDVSLVHGANERRTMSLPLVRVADHVDPQSRAFHFYLLLNNNRHESEPEAGKRFVAWKFRPGQRMVVHVPLSEPWQQQIVLPPSAIVEDGAEVFVFELNGDHFDRVPVHVIYRDTDAIVIENNGKLVGKTVAMSGAYQMHLAIKSKAGGGVDNHGHNH